MKLYLDNSFLNRPFDDPAIGNNKIEAEILLRLIELARKGKVVFVNSAMIEYENSFSVLFEKKAFVEDTMRLAKKYQNLSEFIRKRALAIEQETSIKPLDSLHVASAEAAGVDFLITCDYPNVRKYKGTMRVITPLDFMQNYEDRH